MSDGIFIRNVVSPRAFMSSSVTTEAFQENTKSKAYGSEQIQVKEKLVSLFIIYDVLVWVKATTY